MDSVYCLFECVGDGDSYPRFGLISLHETIEGAREKAGEYLAERNAELLNNIRANIDMHNMRRMLEIVEEKGIESLYEPIHRLMCSANNYVYVGSRNDDGFKNMIDGFGGFIIEEVDIGR